MSEAVADLSYSSGYGHFESRALANLITHWFEQVAAVIPPEKYTKLEPGRTAPLLPASDLGEIAIRYEGSRPTPKAEYEHDQSVPLQTCEYTLFMTEGDVNRSPQESVPLGWWMPLHMEYGPKLVIDAAVAPEEIIGGTPEDRQRLEKLLSGLVEAYTSPEAEIIAFKP